MSTFFLWVTGIVIGAALGDFWAMHRGARRLRRMAEDERAEARRAMADGQALVHGRAELSGEERELLRRSEIRRASGLRAAEMLDQAADRL